MATVTQRAALDIAWERLRVRLDHPDARAANGAGPEGLDGTGAGLTLVCPDHGTYQPGRRKLAGLAEFNGHGCSDCPKYPEDRTGRFTDRLSEPFTGNRTDSDRKLTFTGECGHALELTPFAADRRDQNPSEHAWKCRGCKPRFSITGKLLRDEPFFAQLRTDLLPEGVDPERLSWTHRHPLPWRPDCGIADHAELVLWERAGNHRRSEPGRRCPGCRGHVGTTDNNAAALYPHIAHHQDNAEVLRQHAPFSKARVELICPGCNTAWKPQVHNLIRLSCCLTCTDVQTSRTEAEFAAAVEALAQDGGITYPGRRPRNSANSRVLAADFMLHTAGTTFAVEWDGHPNHDTVEALAARARKREAFAAEGIKLVDPGPHGDPLIPTGTVTSPHVILQAAEDLLSALGIPARAASAVSVASIQARARELRQSLGHEQVALQRRLDRAGLHEEALEALRERREGTRCSFPALAQWLTATFDLTVHPETLRQLFTDLGLATAAYVQTAEDLNWEDLASRYRQGSSLNELAAEAGVSAYTVRARLVHLGCEIRPRGGRPRLTS